MKNIWAHKSELAGIAARKGIPRNLSVFAEVRVNFLGCILTQILQFAEKRPRLFTKFLGRLRVILCYWKTFSVPRETMLKNVRGKFAEDFAEKFVGDSPRIRQTLIKNSNHIRSAEPRDQTLHLQPPYPKLGVWARTADARLIASLKFGLDGMGSPI